MKYLIDYLTKYKKEAIVAPILKLFEAIIDLFFPVIIALIVDNGLKTQDFSYVIKMFIALILLSFMGTIIAVVSQYFSAHVSCNVSKNFREDLFEKAENITLPEMEKIGKETIGNVITNDSFAIQNGLNMFLRLSLRSPFIVIGSIIAAFIIDFKAGLILFFTSFVILLLMILITNVVLPKVKKSQEYKDKLYKIANDNISGIKAVRSFDIEDTFVEKFENVNNEYFKLEEKIHRLDSISAPINYLLINMTIVLVIYLGGFEVKMGYITQGSLIALYNYIAQILVEIVKLASLMVLIPNTLASIVKCESILDFNSDFKNGSKKINPEDKMTLEFKNVFFNFINKEDNSYNILTDLNFKINSGEKIGVLGGTASGKTTIIDLITRMYDVSSGEILINNENIKDYDVKILRNSISVVSQKKYIYKGSIKENIDIQNKKYSEDHLERILNISGANKFVSEKENNLDFKLEEDGKNLSEGQNKRIAIARALAKPFKILLLDEPTSSLDNVTSMNFLNNVNYQIGENQIMILFTQKLSLVEHMDRIIVLDKGKIVAMGKHKDLLEKSETYKEMWYTQIK